MFTTQVFFNLLQCVVKDRYLNDLKRCPENSLRRAREQTNKHRTVNSDVLDPRSTIKSLKKFELVRYPQPVESWSIYLSFKMTSSKLEKTPVNFSFLSFQPLLYAGYTKDSSLVVVERPWKSIVEKLPPPLYRKKYGTG